MRVIASILTNTAFEPTGAPLLRCGAARVFLSASCR